MRLLRFDALLLIVFAVLAVVAVIMFVTAFFMIAQSRAGMESDPPTATVRAAGGTFTPLAPSTTSAATATPRETLRPTPTQFVPEPGEMPKETDVPTDTPDDPDAPTVPVRLYLIALNDDGESGAPAGCGDSLVYVMRTMEEQGSTRDRIREALNVLFGVEERTVDGYYNPAHRSSLSVSSVSMEGDTAVVELSGTLRLDEDCDKSRFEAQLETTIGQFARSVRVTLNGVPIETVLYGG